MLRQLLIVLAGILLLVTGGSVSYIYLSKILGTQMYRAPAEVASQKNAVSTSTRETTKKKAATKIEAPIKTNGSLVTTTAPAPKKVVTPGPLRVSTPTATTTPVPSKTSLSVKGVIEYTNGARSQNGGLPALIENQTLNRDAEIKLADMFANQYFEHISPIGVGPADIAKKVGYAYIIVGENLALGDFGSDQGVVTAWMNSPGHRANILNTYYQEIGVAVGKGMYEGRETWLAVQSFGMPLSACPAVDLNLKSQIDVNNLTIAELRAQLDQKKAQIDSVQMADPLYNEYVNEYNAIVQSYNPLVEANRANVANYNTQVQTFNNCIAAVNTH